MLQSAIFSHLQANQFRQSVERLGFNGSAMSRMLESFSALAAWMRGDSRLNDLRRLSAHLQRDIGLID